MKTIVKSVFGSHVYGCATPTSDTDYKGVFVPEMRDVLLGRQVKNSIVKSTGEQNSKNTSEDIDDEMFTIHGYLKMVAEGQVVALDLLFTPDEFLTEKTPAWDHVKSFAKANLLSKTTTAYVGYCRKQAAKYGLKGARVSDVRELLDLLKTFDQNEKLYVYFEQLKAHCKEKEFTNIIENDKPSKNIGGGGIKNPWADILLECLQKKAAFTIKVKDATAIYQKQFDERGHRALQAESNQNIDWKAMHHALRCCYEAVELLDTGNITFPLKNAEYLLQVKKGEHPYEAVATHLEEMMAEVERAKNRSKLPDAPNWEALDDFIVFLYTGYIQAFEQELAQPGLKYFTKDN